MRYPEFSLTTFSHPTRIRKLDQFQPPNWDLILPLDFSQYEDIFANFARLARLSLDLVDRLAPSLLGLEGQIVQQYTIHVLQSFRHYIQCQSPNRTEHAFLKEQLGMLEAKVESLKLRGFLDEQYDGKWVAMTIFTPVWAALSRRYRLNGRLAKKAKKDPEVRCWKAQLEDFAPASVVFNLTDSIIGESAARWRKLPLMRDWEIDLRNARFPDYVKKCFDAVQEELEEATKNKPLDEQILAAEGGLSRPIGEPFRFGNCYWWAMNPTNFHPIPPCHKCKALYADVKWYGHPRPSENKTFRGGQGVILPWRCAEADVYAQRMEFTEGGSKGKKRLG
jgi:hypothetical protein